MKLAAQLLRKGQLGCAAGETSQLAQTGNMGCK